MLHQLVRYAAQHHLVTEPGFAPKEVRWAITLDQSGRFLGVTSLADPEDKRSRGRLFPVCPELSQPEIKRGGSGCRHFLADSADVVALHADDPADEKLLAKHRYFTDLLRQASAAMPALAAAVAALDDAGTVAAIRDALRTGKAKPTDRVTFALLGATPLYPIESEDWHEWWRRFRRGLGREVSSAADVRCFATGELVQAAPTQPKIAGLTDVGGLSMGDVLASFKQESFCSYGLVQAANAPVSEEVAAAYRAALNDLIREHSRRLVNARVVHWYKDKLKDPNEDPLPWLEEDPGTEEKNAQRRARDLLESIHAGQRADLAGNSYYALTLSGASGRVMVRDWMEGSFEELVRRIGEWFDHLAVVRSDGAGLAAPPKFLAVLGSLLRPKKGAVTRDELRAVPSPLETSLWRAAVRGERIPRQAHAMALARFKTDVLKGNPLSHAGVGLLKAFHVREGDSDMTAKLNEDHPDPAYQCGRLMAMLAAVQHRALGDVGAGVVQRYYAAASATPALVLGRLTRLSQFHLDKLDRGLARWHEGRIADTWGRIQDLPATLSLDKQSVFALGYYHQIAHDRTRTRAAAGEAAQPATEPQETDHE